MADGGQIQCLCGITFAQQNHFSVHQKSCDQSRKRSLSVVDKAREFLVAKKRRRVAAAETRNVSHKSKDPVVVRRIPCFLGLCG